MEFPTNSSFFSLYFTRFGDTLRSIMSVVLFYQLLICAAVTAFNLFALEANGFLNLNAAVSLYLMVSAIITTFLYCFLAERFTTDLLDIAMIFYGSAWYQLPSQYQRMFVLLIKRSQRETRLKCFGLIDCSLSVFSSVSFLQWKRDFFGGNFHFSKAISWCLICPPNNFPGVFMVLDVKEWAFCIDLRVFSVFNAFSRL